MNTFTKRLREAIDKSSYSYAEIEEKLELETGSVEKWILGREEPDTPTVNRLADLLGVSSNMLLFGAETMKEIKAMFPNEATPAHTPMSDWRFLAGVIMVFTGACGILLMVMRYAAEGISMSQLLELVGLPAAIFIAIAASGLVICVVSAFLCLRIPKAKNKKDKTCEK